ncbi:hypothetical protein H257_04287 [Aphanomyces astaci]|uniref:Uncharacterized protein n=1 Tax=Aphanomyces astaci TaxID=112090 RepID=W4GX68_APHAT|nr:hypothetical protein H257_04287 [Aphanomyces astaci]ETV83589.1 hypothetical protein H257_04287 [Aphanomyces astaci]RQM30101.1 hypothetical protein B5M09_005903 [Aphanomyces astaci]|eukprot:XP_009827019.1 hypothetical protein H257_04287 [Aphanomyces astaci]
MVCAMQYALQGVAYVVGRPRMWLVVSLMPMVAALIVGICSVVVLCTAGLFPQAYHFERLGMAPWWATFSSTAVLVGEMFLVTMIYSLVCTPRIAVVVFNKILEARGHSSVVTDAPSRRPSSGRLLSGHVWFRLVVLVASMPLHCIPVAGTIAFVWLNGGRLTRWDVHQVYYDLKGYTYKERKAVYETHRDTYRSIGVHSMYLQLIPVLGFAFTFTNIVGAALFAADLEDDLCKSSSQPTYGSYHSVSKVKMLYI